MSKVRWVRYSPDDFVAGVGGQLSEVEVGYLWMITSLIYSKGGPINDEPARFAGMFKNGRVSTARRAIARLIELGKLRARGDQLTQPRAAKELRRAKSRLTQSRENGRMGGRPKQRVRGGPDSAPPPGELEHDGTASHAQLRSIQNINTFKDGREPAGFAARQPTRSDPEMKRYNQPKSSSLTHDPTIRKMFTDWNERARDCGLTVAQELSPTRAQALKRALVTGCGGDPNVWTRACHMVAQSSFCCGGGERNWRADLDWLLRPDILQRVLEGSYRDGESHDLLVHGVI